MSKYFTNLAEGSIVHRNGKESVDLHELPSDNYCKRLYLEGFRHLGITPEAYAIFKKTPALILEKLIIQKKREGKENEVEILQKALSAKKPKENDRERVSKS